MDPYLLYWMSKMVEKGIAWDKSMEDEIEPFTAGMVGFMPKNFYEKSCIWAL